MSVAASPAGRLLSREEYRRWCETQPGRFERVDGRVIAMAPQRAMHLRGKAAVFLGLRRAILEAGVACQALPDGATVQAGESDFEPDAVVNCGPRMADDDIAVPNPVIVVEVLSPGTAAVDTGRKLIGYFEVESLTHYLIVHPVRRRVIHHRRRAGGIDTTLVSAGALMLEPPGLRTPVDAFFPAD